MTRYHIDDMLDKEVEQIQQVWKNFGMKRVSKPDVIRMLINKYKEESFNTPNILPMRKPKSKEWRLQ